MKREIVLDNQKIVYTVRVNARARSLRMTIDPEQGLMVTIPSPWFDRLVERFLVEKSQWILHHLARMKKLEGRTVIAHTREEYEEMKSVAHKAITERVKFFNTFYKFSYNKISIRNQTSVWGSCTRAGNLQFNVKLLSIPPKALDYVVVHELCHLKEHNHGAQFWKLVEKLVPDYKIIRKSLRGYVMKTK